MIGSSYKVGVTGVSLPSVRRMHRAPVFLMAIQHNVQIFTRPSCLYNNPCYVYEDEVSSQHKIHALKKHMHLAYISFFSICWSSFFISSDDGG